MRKLRKIFDKLFFNLIVCKVFTNKHWELFYINNKQKTAGLKHKTLDVKVSVCLLNDGWYIDSLCCPRNTLCERYKVFVESFILHEVIKHFQKHVLDEDVHVTEWMHRTKGNMNYFIFIEELFTQDYLPMFYVD